MSRLSCLAALAVLVSVTQAVAEETALRFGIVPQGSPGEVLSTWAPVADALSDALGRPVIVETTPDIPTFEACVLEGVYDISYMNPYHYVIASDQVGYRVIAHRAEQQLQGLIVVRADSPFQTIADLEGQVIAFPSPAAFAASILQRAELAEAGITFTPVYTRSHSSSYLSVIRGALQAGAGVNRTFSAFAAENEDAQSLRILHRTRGYTPHAIAVSPRIGQADAQTLADTLADLHKHNGDALKRLAIGAFAQPDSDAYQDVRNLNVTPQYAGFNIARDPACPSD